MSGSPAVGSATPLLASAPSPGAGFVGLSEAHAALDTAEALAHRLWVRESDLPPQAIPILRRAEGFLVAGRSSALAGRWRAAVTFSRIAEEEFKAITQRYEDLGVSPARVPQAPPHNVSLIRVSPDGPL